MPMVGVVCRRPRKSRAPDCETEIAYQWLLPGWRYFVLTWRFILALLHGILTSDVEQKRIHLDLEAL